jgi:hypothetical protein
LLARDGFYFRPQRKESLYFNTDRSVGIWKCYLCGREGVKRELWFQKMGPTSATQESRLAIAGFDRLCWFKRPRG